MAFKKFGSDKRGGFRSGPGPRFGGGERRFGEHAGSQERFNATCADCGASCEVPFRPNGKKPVYCKECLPKHYNDREERAFSRPSPRFERREFPRQERPSAPREFSRPAAPMKDSRIDTLVRDIAVINGKLDALAELLAARAAVPAPKAKKAVAKKRAK